MHCFIIIFILIFIKEWNMGQRASDTRGITFEDVVIPEEVGIFSMKYMLSINSISHIRYIYL